MLRVNYYPHLENGELYFKLKVSLFNDVQGCEFEVSDLPILSVKLESLIGLVYLDT